MILYGTVFCMQGFWSECYDNNFSTFICNISCDSGVWICSRFLETFDEGTWFPILVYIRKVNGPEDQLDTQEKQITWVTSVARQKVKFMSGQPGVVVLDHDDGRKRIKIGRSAETETREDRQLNHTGHLFIKEYWFYRNIWQS